MKRDAVDVVEEIKLHVEEAISMAVAEAIEGERDRKNLGKKDTLAWIRNGSYPPG